MSMLQPAQLIEHLTDAFEQGNEQLPDTKSATLAECVPLLAIALEFIGRGPAALTVDAVERYRLGAVKILEHLTPVIERVLSTGVWTHDHPLQVDTLKLLGLPVSVGIGTEERNLMRLYPQPRGREASVEYVSGPRLPPLLCTRQ